MFPEQRSRSLTAVKTMESRRQHRTTDLRDAQRKTRDTSNRFAEEDLRLENKQLRERLALLSHECRTPLQAVFGYAELLDAEVNGGLNESQRRYVQRIKQSNQHLLGLINAILDERVVSTDSTFTPRLPSADALG